MCEEVRANAGFDSLSGTLPGMQVTTGVLRGMPRHRVYGQVANVAEKGEQIIQYRIRLLACCLRKRPGERPPAVVLQRIGPVINRDPALCRHGLPQKNQKLSQCIRTQVTQRRLLLDSGPEQQASHLALVDIAGGAGLASLVGEPRKQSITVGFCDDSLRLLRSHASAAPVRNQWPVRGVAPGYWISAADQR